MPGTPAPDARPVVVDPLVCGRPVTSADRVRLPDVRGGDLADVGAAPRLMALSALRELRRHADGVPPGQELFDEAATLFEEAELDGETPEEYAARVSYATGLTAAAVAQSVRDLVDELRELSRTTAAELPATGFAADPAAGPGTGSGSGSAIGFATRWVPRGRVFAAVMASNHPTPHVTWAQALFHGYSVAVKPGSRDPFTALRLTRALLAAGLPPRKLAFLPASHRTGEFLLREADRGIVYGGDSAVRRWQGDETVAVRGPGRTKALLDRDADEAITAHLALSASYDGGTRCTNLSAVLTTRPVAEVADALARRLATLPSVPVTTATATLLVADRERAARIRAQVDELRAAPGVTDHSARHDPAAGETVVELADGSHLLRPLVLSVEGVHHPAVGTELPFPFVVVAPWTPADGVAPLRESLVLNLLTDDEELVDAAVREPSVRKITRGAVLPWTAVPGIPHDDNYTQFLLEPKGVVATV
ncbi:aldehyde dehydrogenase family protein [Streptomyces sp. NPDC127092]|uniref:aldehyde dehydrogenase family protein n=1 Tax=Streptomyces sp. NPDC127092 TaxID=3347135 RepID=UPI00364DD81B